MAKRGIGVSLLVLIVALLGCKQFSTEYEKSFKEEFLKSFVKSCTETATQKGTDAAQAGKLCECVGKDLVAKHDSTELTKTASDPNSPESEKIMNDAFTTCAPKP